MRRQDYNPHMKRLIALFPQRPIGAETVAAYWELLCDMDADLFATAARACAAMCEWFPTVKQLLDAADAAAARAHGILTPEEAWERVSDVARGWYDGQSVRDLFDATTFNALQHIGGIRSVATADAVGVNGKRRDFLLAYQRPYVAQVEAARTLPLPERLRALREVA